MLNLIIITKADVKAGGHREAIGGTLQKGKREAVHLEAEFLIVGAGPAGCVLAWELHRAGCDVIVLEQYDDIAKEKLCGGVLTASALTMLETLYGADMLRELAPTYPPRFVARSHDRETYASIPIATVPRKRLDNLLLARCLQAGVAVRDRTRLVSLDGQGNLATCEDLRTGEPVQVRYGTLIGADGAASTVRRLLTSRKQGIALSLEGSVPLAGDDIVFEYRHSQEGYCWYIPNDSEAIVGCMLHDGSAQDCRSWIYDFCKSLRIDVPSLRGAPIPSGDDVLLRAGEDAWLVGDAAGLAHPLDGGGIQYALESAHLLASSLLGGTAYEQAMRPLLDFIARDAEQIQSWYLLRSLYIVRNGHECTTWENRRNLP